MVDYIPSEKATPIRMPSTANLMIDSADKVAPAFTESGNFRITKQQAILNGFFTRIATTEVVVEWNIPNITTLYGNETFQVDVSGAAVTAELPDGFYTVAQALDTIVPLLNADTANYTFSLVTTGAFPQLRCEDTATGADQDFTIEDTTLPNQLGFEVDISGNFFIPGRGGFVDLRWWRYIDFVSNDLTYTQDVKDGATNQDEKNVLCRFYLTYDTPAQNDKYGFPILFGYQAIPLRRIFSPPKQIKWEPNLPVGNLSFQVYGNGGGNYLGAIDEYVLLVSPSAIPPDTYWNWLMTLQVSEQ
jgi:hypothetical protein